MYVPLLPAHPRLRHRWEEWGRFYTWPAAMDAITKLGPGPVRYRRSGGQVVIYVQVSDAGPS
jgi:hypothetical protein